MGARIEVAASTLKVTAAHYAMNNTDKSQK